VNIALSTQGDVCRIAWQEQGGPRIDEEPQHRGFGAKLSAVSIEGQLGGSLSRRWLPEGLAVEIECPASSFSRA
jgi:two-component sensor histidine kinase